MIEKIDDSFRNDIDTVSGIPMITRLLDTVCESTGMGFAAVARVTDDRWVTCSSRDDLEFGLKPGDELAIGTTICTEIRRNRQRVVIDHVEKDADYRSHHTPQLYGFQSYISVPIILSGGEFFGTLCAIDPKPRMVSLPHVVSMFELFAELIAKHLDNSREMLRAQEDVREQLMLNKRMMRNEEKINVILDASGLGTYELDLRTMELNYSGRFLEIFGFMPDDKVSHTEIVSVIHPEDLETRAKAHKVAYETGTLHYDARLIWRDGSIHWMEGRGKVFFDDAGTPIHMMGTVSDITESKNAEKVLEQMVADRTQQLQHYNEQLEKANRELRSFAYISSHDLQEPLRKIQTFTSWIEEKEAHKLSPDGRHYFERIGNAAGRMQALIRDLLDFSQVEIAEKSFRKLNLNHMMEEIFGELQEEINTSGCITEVSDLREMKVIPFQFRQVIFNLISNSMKFAHPERPLHIKISRTDLKGSELSFDGPAHDSDYGRITVCDNGIGFEQQYAERIFGLFQRLHGKLEYVGTGIGLSIARKIADNHRGFIRAEGRPGEGAAFHFYIPLN